MQTPEDHPTENSLKGSQKESLRATAYHEAGHAVLALSVGRPIHRVTIVPNQHYVGACRIQKGRIRATDDWLEDEILILFAGMVAEARVTGHYSEQGAATDLRAIRRFVSMRAQGARQVERLERRMLDKTEYLLHDSSIWKAVEAIASELLARETISGRAARHLFDQAHRENE